MTGTYSQSLVVFSLLVAILASRGRVARWWLAGGAGAMGLGIWSMHFIGMLAFHLPIPVGYDLAITLYSLAVSVGASAYALWLVSRAELPWSRLCAGAVLMGLGIAAMHYLGMAALEMQPGIDYDPLWFAASVLIAIGAAGAALWIAFRLRLEQRRPFVLRGLASLVMGLAIVGMHYTGMAAAHFPEGAMCGAAYGEGIETKWLAVLVIVTTLATLGIALIASVFDRQMRTRTGLLADSLAQANEKLMQAALHDPLTQLPNRMLLQDRIEQAIEKAQRRQFSFAVMFCDLDGFKAINDAYGHQLGDQLLIQVSKRITAMLRAQDTFARLGGDEFVIVFQVEDPEDAAVVAERIIGSVAEPFEIDALELQVSASLGIALYPADATTERDLMAHADAAMYHTKDSGRNGYTFFTQSLNVSANRQLKLLQELRKAVSRGELVLHYQPKFQASGTSPIGAEALVRWQHPELGLLSPDAFIPIAERSGLILSIGDWVLDKACAQLRHWHDAGHPDWTMAVNLSPLQFGSSTLLETVRRTLVDPGSHRDHRDARCGSQPADPARADRDGREHLHRRLRHRLLQPAVSQAHAGHRAEDRPRLRARPGRQRRRRGDRFLDHRIGPVPAAADRRRGRGNGRSTPVPERHGLRPAAGLSPRAAGRRRGVHAAGESGMTRGEQPVAGHQ